MIYGVDIGGVNIKISQLTKTGEGLQVKSASIPFSKRGDMIEKLIYSVVSPDLVVVTQTICGSRQHFSSAKEGTHYVIDVTERIFGEDKVRFPGLPLQLYTAKEAKKEYLKVAARNWVATCYLASSYLKLFENGLVIDCGTTSTDIVPVVNSKPITLDGDNDRGYTRTKTGELVWSGLYFTHIPMISTTVVLDGERFRIKSGGRGMTFDIYVVLGLVSVEDFAAKYGNWRQDMQMISYDLSVDRMFDTISADRELLSVNDAKKIAQFLAEKQRENTETAIEKVLSATKKKYGHDAKVAGIAGAGKDIILRKILDNLGFEEVIDIEKAASETLDITDLVNNCEASLGCALMGLQD